MLPTCTCTYLLPVYLRNTRRRTALLPVLGCLLKAPLPAGAYRGDESYLDLCAERVARLQQMAFDLGMNFYGKNPRPRPPPAYSANPAPLATHWHAPLQARTVATILLKIRNLK